MSLGKIAWSIFSRSTKGFASLDKLVRNLSESFEGHWTVNTHHIVDGILKGIQRVLRLGRRHAEVQLR